MTPKPPRMTQMSWAEVREALDAHQQAIQQLFANTDALRESIGGEVVDGKLSASRVGIAVGLIHAQERTLEALQRKLGYTYDIQTDTMRPCSFWGRLRWLLTGKVL